MTIKSFQGLGLVNHNIPPPPLKKKLQTAEKLLRKNYIILQGR